MRLLPLLGVAFALTGCSHSAPADPSKPSLPGASVVAFEAADGVTVYANLVKATGTTKSLMLMFHQARSSASEYAPIAPRIANMGFDCLAVNLCSGGDMYGPNPTAEKASGPKDYMATYKDMEAALKWAVDQKRYKIVIAWGSSYSASLCLKLASEHPEVKAVLAFSPGEYMDEKGIVAKWNSQVKVPVFYACTKLEADDVAKIDKSKPADSSRHDDALMAAADGVHGSSTLREDKNPKGAAAYWSALENFVKAHKLLGTPRG